MLVRRSRSRLQGLLILPSDSSRLSIEMSMLAAHTLSTEPSQPVLIAYIEYCSFLALLLLLSTSCPCSRRYRCTARLDKPSLINIRCRNASILRRAQILNSLRQRCHLTTQPPKAINQSPYFGAFCRLILETCARDGVIRLQNERRCRILGARLRRRRRCACCVRRLRCLLGGVLLALPDLRGGGFQDGVFGCDACLQQHLLALTCRANGSCNLHLSVGLSVAATTARTIRYWS